MGILKDLMGMDFMKQGSGAVNDLVAYNNYQSDLKDLAKLQDLYSLRKNWQMDNLIDSNPKNPALSPTGGYPPNANLNNGQGLNNANQNLGAGTNQGGAGTNQGGTVNPLLLQQIMGALTYPYLKSSMTYPTQQNTQPQPNPQQNAGGNPPVTNPPAQAQGIYPPGGILSDDLLRDVLPGGVDKAKYFKTLANQDYSNSQLMARMLGEVNNPWMQINGTYDNLYKNMTDQDTEMRKEIKPTEFSVGDKVYQNYLGRTTQVAGMPPKLDPEIEKLKQDKLPKKTEMLAYTKKEKNGSSEFTVDYYQEVDEKGNPVFIENPKTGEMEPKIVRTQHRGAGFNTPSSEGSGRIEEIEKNKQDIYKNLNETRKILKNYGKWQWSKNKNNEGVIQIPKLDGSGEYDEFRSVNDLIRKGIQDTEKYHKPATDYFTEKYHKPDHLVNGKPLLPALKDALYHQMGTKGKTREEWDRNKYKAITEVINGFEDMFEPIDKTYLELWLKTELELDETFYKK